MRFSRVGTAKQETRLNASKLKHLTHPDAYHKRVWMRQMFQLSFGRVQELNAFGFEFWQKSSSVRADLSCVTIIFT